ncbi:MAG: SirB1 family protein [bacterium]
MFPIDHVHQLGHCLKDDAPDLFSCALKIATHRVPFLDVAHYQALMSEWSKELATRVEGIDDIRIRIEHLNRYFFGELSFRGNQQDYHNPANSLLNEVMDSRLGLPITLSVLYVTLGRSIQLPLEGVSFPGHFLVKVVLPEGVVMLDPYNGGQSLDEQALADLLLEHKKNSDAETLLKSLESASTEEVLLRMLRNLKIIYHDEKEHEFLLAVLNMMLEITPDLREERLERGLLLHEMECNHVALDDLRHYLAQPPMDSNDDVLKLVNWLSIANTPIH